jgi:hypothetical protein
MTKWNTTGSEARGSAARNTSQRLSQPDNTADPLTPKNVGGSRFRRDLRPSAEYLFQELMVPE